MTIFRISSPIQEGLLQVSKWIKVQVLLDQEEIVDLFKQLDPFYLVAVSKPVKEQSALLAQNDFLQVYLEYVQLLKKSKFVQGSYFRECFSCAMTRSKEVFYAMPVSEKRLLIKPVLPVIQMQMHQFLFSFTEKIFYPMVLGQNTVSWGIQFSYPQFYQDPKTKEITRVIKKDLFPNTELFALLMKWVRQFTIPTPFLVGEERINATIRIGKKCMSWIHSHPQLQQLGIKVLCLD
ncbi:hypothetical protein RHABOEDO_001726 [Candidatus Rhabdochlamydia oedothoracis]|uniref:Uncharacterized protein n=1 Tax=Candidatus Rhabdochlamydia oedothoracis TaxID=2720720 RepID=A0ABX8V2C7_9BACT|nr:MULTISPECIES: hypothetical protein [Rhabdochlamydia]KAG6558744.1 hypothetical protein RHOW815_001267 [Candidatus Rhabdochlamydia sp. W815]MCL6756744.1 hypothetical protein [Candidatus Rhabdochlamydia oedothoracis]QYF49394.1 hypothetical protein RHABOEDO_001726 [Candidatus Rhabdochlamydia oedothoracis]